MTSFALIDYENVQPKNVSRLNGGRYSVKVFAGAKQKVTVDMANALQALGQHVEYIQMAGEGNNALDFHISPTTSAASPRRRRHVISGDTGFDPLIKHLAAKKISCQRWKTIADMASDWVKQNLPSVIADLQRRKTGRPSTVKTLRSTVNALFQKQLSEEELDALVDGLTRAGTMKVTEGKVQYALPA